MQLAILTGFFGASVWAHCPPCGMHTVLTQTKLAPWANVPPPAPDAPVTACGCGVDKVTPRDDLQKMSSADQRSMIGKLKKETTDLQEQVDELNKEHTEVLDKLKARVKKAEDADEKQRKDFEESQEKRNNERQEAKDAIESDQEDLELASKDIAEHKATLKELQGELTIRLMEMESCGCKEKKFLLTQTTQFASFLAAQLSGTENAPLYMEIEELEGKRNALNEELTDEMGSFGMKQRSLLHRVDILENKMGRQEATAEQYEHTDENMAKGTKRQGKAMSEYLAHKNEQLERIEKDVKAAQDKYDDLEKAMAKCGCGPKR